MPGYVHPTHCDLCGVHTASSYEVHMVLVHPETRPKPQRPEYTAKELRKMQAAKERRDRAGRGSGTFEAPLHDDVD